MWAYEIEGWLRGKKLSRKVWEDTPSKKNLYYIFENGQWKYGTKAKATIGYLGKDKYFELFEYNDWEGR